jgi:dienelactone hydrolase
MKTCALALACILAVLACAAQETPKPFSPEAAAKQVIQELAAGQFEKIETQYDERVATALPPGKLGESWKGLIQQIGPFESILDTKASKTQGLDVVTMTCKFQNVVLEAHVAFDPDGKIAGLNFRPHKEAEPDWTPPAYAKPDSFTEQPLTLVNGKFELPGTLTIPKGDGPFSAVVLVQGSGPNDQDETIGPNKPFKDLAWGLGSRGVAVFRYTKRTMKYGIQSSDDPAKLTVDDEVISDARAAVALLAKQPKIDAKRVFLLGHSLGAYLAPRIASGDSQIAGIVMLAANTRPIEKVIVEQIRYIASQNGAPDAEAQKQIASAEETAKKIESPDLKPGDSVPLLGASMPGAYWLDLRDYHPAQTAAKLTIPILILQGGRDYQVTPSNFEDWKKALATQKNVTLRLYPDLNHLFIAGSGPSTPQEYEKPSHVAEEPVADIAAWISRGGQPPK